MFLSSAKGFYTTFDFYIGKGGIQWMFDENWILFENLLVSYTLQVSLWGLFVYPIILKRSRYELMLECTQSEQY